MQYSTVGYIDFEYECQTNLNFKFNVLEEMKRDEIQYSTIKYNTVQYNIYSTIQLNLNLGFMGVYQVVKVCFLPWNELRKVNVQ